MLELLVLGQIPGTNFQITFQWTMLIIAIVLIAIDVKIHRRHAPSKKQKAEVIRLSSL